MNTESHTHTKHRKAKQTNAKQIYNKETQHPAWEIQTGKQNKQQRTDETINTTSTQKTTSNKQGNKQTQTNTNRKEARNQKQKETITRTATRKNKHET